METLTLHGKQYVKASKIASDLGYTSDYVGQLCRKHLVDAHLVGRTWYVDPDGLTAHRIEKKRNARVKAREQVQKTIVVSQQKRTREIPKIYKKLAIRYENDKADILPPVQKISVVSEQYIQPTNPDGSDLSGDGMHGGYEILNKDKKILMSGTVPVIDAEAEIVPTDTVLLTPRILQKQERNSIQTELSTPADDYVHHTALAHLDREESISFEEKLAAYEGEVGDEDVDYTHEVHTDASQSNLSVPPRSRTVTRIFLYSFYLVTALVVLCTLSTETLSYTTDRGDVDRTWEFTPSGIAEIMAQKI